MRRSPLALATLVLLALAVPAVAQQYPARPVEFVIPFAPGGPTDTAIRIIQPQLAANLGAAVVLVNKPGGGGAVGMDGVAKARPDGYTLAATVRSTLTILPATQPDVTYKIADFAVIGSYAIDSGVILVKAGAPWKTLEAFVEYARKNPGTVTYGSAGLGTNSYFNMELLQQAYGLTLSHVPFNGSGPVKNAILGGHVPIGAAALSAVLSVIRSGDIVALATSASKRVPAIPGTPTMTEKGQPEASLSTWMELYAPARTPKAIVDRLAAALEKTMKDPAVIAAIDKAGLTAEYHDPAATLRLVERENEIVVGLAKKLNLGQ
ncbi:MAG: tripartite tricarboxylate transporter substrate binding protein [Candidatus Rokuibacteriota bacterium]|nr:MAG: tripartite tricarboxylate transporter substrate binding protein [Candidatus Rokubacteria bacterium]